MDKPVLILGAGINGAAIARELLLNRIPVCIVDSSDIASGATAYSSRLIHGGLRYLEHREFDLVRESLTERSGLLRLAPQYVKPLRLFIPSQTRMSGLLKSVLRFWGWRTSATSRHVPRGHWLVRIGLWLYDTYANDPKLPCHAVHSLGDEGVPRVSKERFRWMASYYDAQIEYPERFVLALLEDAQRLAEENNISFRIWTYHEVRQNDCDVQIFSRGQLRNTSEKTSPSATIQPIAIVNATGAWVDHTLNRLGIESDRLTGGTKGSHILTSNQIVRFQLADAGIYAEAEDGRPIFLLPLGRNTLIGTTDLPYSGDPRTVTASEEEMEYLLDAANRILDSVHLTRDDIEMHYCGVRPLPYVTGDTPGAITRRHWLEESKSSPIPLFSVIGGKLTTCRSLAEETVATILPRLGRPVESDSRGRVLPGGENYPTHHYTVASAIARIATTFGFTKEQTEFIWSLYGTRTESVLHDCETNPTLGSGTIPLGMLDLPVAFVRWVIRNEWVRTLSDLVERRLMLIFRSDLSIEALVQLAMLLREEHIISSEHVDTTVRQCATRLRQRYGKELSRNQSDHGG